MTAAHGKSPGEILQEMRHDFDRGALVYKEIRYLLIQPEIVCEFMKGIEEAVGPEAAAAALLAGGHRGGLRSFRRFREKFGFSNAEAVEFLCRMAGQIGWGSMQPVEVTPQDGRLVVEVAGSPFAEAYGKTDHGVCHLIRGVLAGMAEGLFGNPVESEETMCLAKGDPLCRIEVRVRE